MESFVHLRKGSTPRRLRAGPDQRDKLRAAVEIVTDWLIRHDFASAE